jgi:PAS domain S-box-containing protein
MSLHPSGRLELDMTQLQRLLAEMPFSVVVYTGPDHRAVFSNAVHDEMTSGRLRLGVPLLESLPELAGQRVFEALGIVYSTGETIQDEEVHAQLIRNGRLADCWFQVTWQAIHDAAGHITGVIVSAIEISSHVRARRQLERSRAEALALEAAARDSERHLRELVDNLPEIAWSAGPDGSVDFYNQRWYEYTGTTLEQMKSWGWQSVHDPLYLESVLAAWRHSLASGEPFEMEFPLRRADGAYRWFLTRVRPLKNHAGEVVRWYGTNTDIDDQRRG